MNQHLSMIKVTLKLTKEVRLFNAAFISDVLESNNIGCLIALRSGEGVELISIEEPYRATHKKWTNAKKMLVNSFTIV